MSSEARIPWRYRSRRLVRRIVPVVVWGLTVAVAATLYTRKRGQPALVAIADAVRVSVEAELPGRIRRVHVSADAWVEHDQVVASLDDRELRLRLEEAKAELTRISAELARETARVNESVKERRGSAESALRRFARDLEQAQVEYLSAVADQEEDRIRLQGLELRLERSKKLSSEDMVAKARLDDDRTARDALDKLIKERSTMLEQMKTRRAAAKRRYEQQLKAQSSESGREHLLVATVFEKASKVQEHRLEQIRLEISRLLLRAPMAGVVETIVRHEGEFVSAGQSVVRILRPQASRVTAYVSEKDSLAILPGSPVELVRSADPRQVYKSTIGSIGRRVVQVPARIDPPNAPRRWALPLQVALPDGIEVRPGESFSLRFVQD